MTRISSNSPPSSAVAPSTETAKAELAIPQARDVYHLAGRALANVAMPTTAAGLITLGIGMFTVAPGAAVIGVYGLGATLAGLLGIGVAHALSKR